MPALGWKILAVAATLGLSAAAHAGIVLSEGADAHAWDSTARPIDSPRLHDGPARLYDFDGYAAGSIVGRESYIKPQPPLAFDPTPKTDDNPVVVSVPPRPAVQKTPGIGRKLNVSPVSDLTDSPPPQAIAVVPEPAGVSLVLAAGLGMLRRSRRK